MKKMLAVSTVLILLGLSTAAGQGKISGVMFGDYYYNMARDASFGGLSNVASPAGGTAFQAFQFRRIDLTYDNDISEQFTTRFRLEADQIQETVDGTKSFTTTIPKSSITVPIDTSTKGVTATVPAGTGTISNQASKISTFVKDAFLKWKNVFSGSDLIFGIQPTPAFDISEAAWGYRSLEKTIMDLRGIVSSRDIGLALRGKITGDGMINYWLMVGNNSGNAPETDKYKRYYANIQVKPTTNLQATIYVDYKDAANILNSYTNSSVSNSATTAALFVGYSEPFSYNVGIEGFLQSTSNALKDTAAKSYNSKTAIGISIFGSYYIIPELAVVARYDDFNPSTDDNSKNPAHYGTGVAGNLARNYIIAGLSWKVDKNVSIMPNVLYETYNAANGKTAPNASVTARLTVNYVFL